MNLSDLKRWAHAGGHGDMHINSVEVGTLTNYELAWNYYSDVRKGGAANVMEKAGATVYGVLLDVDAQTLGLIDIKEGHPDRYTRWPSPLPIIRHRDGVRINAWVYQVTEAYRQTASVPPRPEYLQLVIDAAHHFQFPESVLRSLTNTVTRLAQRDYSAPE